MADVRALFAEFSSEYTRGGAPDTVEYVRRAGDRADEFLVLVGMLLDEHSEPEPEQAAVARAAAALGLADIAEPQSVLSGIRQRWSAAAGDAARRVAEEWLAAAGGLRLTAAGAPTRSGSAQRLTLSGEGWTVELSDRDEILLVGAGLPGGTPVTVLVPAARHAAGIRWAGEPPGVVRGTTRPDGGLRIVVGTLDDVEDEPSLAQVVDEVFVITDHAQ